MYFKVYENTLLDVTLILNSIKLIQTADCTFK